MNAVTRCLMVIGFGLLLPSVSLAQAYPAKPVRFIIPFPPGGPTDLMGRIAAERLTRAWGVQVIADNRGGAGGNIGFEQCAKSLPDGYTICMMTVAQSISPSIYKKLGYDPLKDFSHVTVVDQISGQIELAFNTAVTVMPHVKAGKLKPIAISTKERFPPMPDLQTVNEGGVKGFDGSSWQAVVMPAGTSREIVAKVYRELASMLKSADTREKFLAQGALAGGIEPDQFTAFVKREIEKWAKVAKAANVKLD